MTIKEEVKNYIKESEQKRIMTDTQIYAEMEQILWDIEIISDNYFTARERDMDTFKAEIESKVARFLAFAEYLK